MHISRFWKRWLRRRLKRIVLEWLDDYLDEQVGQLLVYLGERGWTDEDGLRVPADKLPEFARDFARGIVHVLKHG